MASHVARAVTGERDYPSKGRVWQALDYELESHSWDSLAIYCGDCPTGADRYTREWWHAKHGENAIKIEADEPLLEIWENVPGPDLDGNDDGFRNRLYVFIADWDRLGGYAGPERNGRLAKRFAYDCGTQALAFWSGDRKRRNKSGTLDAMEQFTGYGVSCLTVPPIDPLDCWKLKGEKLCR